MVDAVIVGSGPNGLAAGITLAEAGLDVTILEAADEPGGGVRTKELTLPGWQHDVCSAVHPLAALSPAFKEWPLEQFGLEWIYPEVQVAHPFDDGTAAAIMTDWESTLETLGRDAESYRNLMVPFAEHMEKLLPDLLAPLHLPNHPWKMGTFGRYAMQSAVGLVKRRFNEVPARSLFTGMAAHTTTPLTQITTAAFGLVLGICAHGAGWPFPKGGARSITNALLGYFKELGGLVHCQHPVTGWNDLPESRVVLFDTDPHQMQQIAGHLFRRRYSKQLQRYRFGPGVFKLDWALDAPIPFRNELCRRAGTVHLGGHYQAIITESLGLHSGKIANKPFVLLAQPTVYDSSRAPDNNHIAWGYCHVPHGSTVNMTERIEKQIERFAPGFTEHIIARHIMNARGMEEYNPNYIGGDIMGGMQGWKQLFTRPVVRWNPYTTPAKNIYLCSSSTPPGGGVHGMCGYNAAHTVLKQTFS